MLTKLFRPATPPRHVPQALPTDALLRACDAIMQSRERSDAAPGHLSSYRLDCVTEPPTAATVELVFHRQYPSGLVIEIPRGTRVATSHALGGGQTFMTGRTVRIEPGQNEVRVLAYHAEFVDGELLGFTTGLRRTLSVGRVPIVAATTVDLELVVGVACDASELADTDRVAIFQGRPFRLWSEVGSIWTPRTGGRLFIADRLAGEISLLPEGRREDDHTAAPTASPRREIRAWYWRGGGASGNVAANTLSVVHDSLRSVVVTNPVAARGGQGPELARAVAHHAGIASASAMR